MKVLVTGATGMVGNNLVRLLLDAGHQCNVLIRPPQKRRELDGLDINVFAGDLADDTLIESAMEDADAVVHAAAMIHFGWTKMDASRQVNVEITRRIAEASIRAGVRLIHVSSVDVLAPGQKDQPATELNLDPAKVACAYVVTKREADQMLLEKAEQGLDVVIVHPGLMFGGWDWKPSSGEMITSIAEQFVPFTPRGGIATCDVLDVCRGLIKAIEKGRSGERYILAGHNVTYLELWQKIAELLGRRKPLCRLGPAINWGVGLFGDLFYKLRGNEGAVNSAALKLGSLYNYYDSAKAVEELDYEISPLEPALERAIGFLVSQKMLDEKFKRTNES